MVTMYWCSRRPKSLFPTKAIVYITSRIYRFNFTNYTPPFFSSHFNFLIYILTFNTKTQVWWLLLGNKKFSTIESSQSSLNFYDLELSFINNLKFLNVSKKNFQKIIDNKKAGWRYDNKYIKYISWYKYQANSLVTYNNSQNFEDEVLKYIKNSSPLKSQQIIVPHEEIKRLTKLFDNTNNLYFKNPDIIVLEKNSLIKKYSNINLNEYCLLKTPQYLYIYVNLKKTNCDHV